jgi:hypothetical protein
VDGITTLSLGSLGNTYDTSKLNHSCQVAEDNENCVSGKSKKDFATLNVSYSVKRI